MKNLLVATSLILSFTSFNVSAVSNTDIIKTCTIYQDTAKMVMTKRQIGVSRAEFMNVLNTHYKGTSAYSLVLGFVDEAYDVRVAPEKKHKNRVIDSYASHMYVKCVKTFN